MSKRRDGSDSTYKPSAEAKPTREEQYQLRSGRYTVVLDESDSDIGFEGSDRDKPVARQPVKVERLSGEIEQSESQEMSQEQTGGFSMEVFMRMMVEIETSRERRREEANRCREERWREEMEEQRRREDAER